MNFDCWFKLNCKIFGSWLYFNACLLYYRCVHLLFIATHDMICYMYVKLFYINEHNFYAWWNYCQKGRSNVKIFGFLEKQGEFLESCWDEHLFGSIENFFLLKRGRSFLFDFWARCVHLYEVCFLPPNIKTFLWICQCVHQGGDCKIKGVFDYYSVMNNWALEIIGFVIWNLFTKWFWRWLDLQVNRRFVILCGLVRPGSVCRSDRRVSRGQTS